MEFSDRKLIGWAPEKRSKDGWTIFVMVIFSTAKTIVFTYYFAFCHVLNIDRLFINVPFIQKYSVLTKVKYLHSSLWTLHSFKQFYDFDRISHKATNK